MKKIFSISLSLLLCITGFIVLCSIDEPISIQDKVDSDIDLFVIEDGKQTVTEIPEGLSANEWDDIQVRLQESRYYPTWSQAVEGYVAANPEHQWGITYDEGAVLVNPSSGKDWSWLLTPASYGYRGNMVPMNDDPEVIVNENNIEFVYDKDLTCWYINDEKGLEHGFTINAPPQPISTGNLLFEMFLQTTLTSKTINEGENIAFLDDSGKIVLYYGKLIVTDANGHIIPSTLCIFSDSITISVKDTNAVYPLEIDPILMTEITKLTASDGAAGDNFGQSVSISGDTVVIGARFDDVGANDHQGSAYIFERNQGGSDNWGEVVKITASDGEVEDHFGVFVSISGDTIAVGAPYEDSGVTNSQGAVYIFERNQGGPNNWGEITKVLASDGFNEDYFGAAVSIDGDTLVVGAYRDDIGGQVDQGSAYIFERNQGGSDNWGEVTKITTLDGLGNDLFGNSVSICNDTVAIGAFGDDIGTEANQGSVCIFERNLGGPDNWGLVKKITASDGLTLDSFGSSVSIHEDTLVVGAEWDDHEGSAYIFERDEGGIDNWGVVAKLLPTADDHLAHFGTSASINRDTIIIGACVDDIDGNEDQGSVYIYYRNLGGNNNWGMVDMITSSDGEAGDYFGFSVSIKGDTFIVSANCDNISGEDEQGSAYIYRLILSNNKPTITTLDNTTAYEDSLYSTDYDADDLDGDTLTWSLWTDASSWLTIDSNTGVLSGTPENSDVGLWTVNVSVSDGKGGTDFSNFTLTVENTNDDPQITTGNVNSANTDELYSVDYEATDDDLSDTLSWDLDTNASWLYIDSSSGILSGFPDESDVGSYWVNVSVSDGNGGSDFTDFTLTVLNPNNAPIIITDNINSVLEGELYSVDYDAMDDDQDILSWTLNTNASWLGIDSSSGVLSGTPDGNDVGSYSVKVTVSDGKGGSDKTEFTLEVLADSDGDGIPDSDDTDNDNDGYMDNNDAFPDDPDEWLDTDEDGIGNNADSDDDNDGYDDDEDDLPLDDGEWLDTDNDRIGNIADDDDDDDGYDDDEDDFPLDDTEWLDTDNDGIGNNEDTDDDDDGVLDINDKYPLDSKRSKDAEDQESMNMYILLILIIIIAFILILVSIKKNKKVKAGETAAYDPDTDNDGLTDGNKYNIYFYKGEHDYGTDPLNADTDDDTLTDYDEVMGTHHHDSDPTTPDSDGDGLFDPEEVLDYSYQYPNTPCTNFLIWFFTVPDNGSYTITIDAKIDEEGIYKLGASVDLKQRLSAFLFQTLESYSFDIGLDNTQPHMLIISGPSEFTTTIDKVEITKQILDPKEMDTDGDGLSDGIEVFGWDICVIKNSLKLNYTSWSGNYNYTQTYEGEGFYEKYWKEYDNAFYERDSRKHTIHVDSNPRETHSYSPNLDDYQNFLNGTDPRSSDTDGDLILDVTEIEKFDGMQYNPTAQEYYEPDFYNLKTNFWKDSDQHTWLEVSVQIDDAALRLYMVKIRVKSYHDGYLIDYEESDSKTWKNAAPGIFTKEFNLGSGIKSDLLSDDVYVKAMDYGGNINESKVHFEGLLEKIFDFLENLWSSFVGALQAFLNALLNIWELIIQPIVRAILNVVLSPIVNAIHNYVSGVVSAVDGALNEYIRNMNSPGWVSGETQDKVGKAIFGILYEPIKILLGIFEFASKLVEPILDLIGGTDTVSDFFGKILAFAFGGNPDNKKDKDITDNPTMGIISTIFKGLFAGDPGFLLDGRRLTDEERELLGLPDKSATDQEFADRFILIIITILWAIFDVMLAVAITASGGDGYSNLALGLVLVVFGLIIIGCSMDVIITMRERKGQDTTLLETIIKASTTLLALTGVVLASIGAFKTLNIFTGILWGVITFILFPITLYLVWK